jgi:hypothetical protein
MTATLTTATPIAPARGTIFTPTILCAGMLTLITAAFIAGFLVTGTEATTLAIGRDGADLTRLMRFLAAIKGVMALGAAAAGRWRVGGGHSLPRDLEHVPCRPRRAPFPWRTIRNGSPALERPRGRRPACRHGGGQTPDHSDPNRLKPAISMPMHQSGWVSFTWTSKKSEKVATRSGRRS